MNIDQLVFAFAGIVILLSLFLFWIHSPYWIILTVFVGANMLQAAFTGFCPLARVLQFFGFRPGPAFR